MGDALLQHFVMLFGNTVLLLLNKFEMLKEAAQVRSIDREKLKKLREEHNWTQRQLAQLAGVAMTVVSRLENGNQKDCRVSALASIATTLGVTVDSLLEDQSIENLQGLIPELRILITQLNKEPVQVQRNALGVLKGLLDSYK